MQAGEGVLSQERQEQLCFIRGVYWLWIYLVLWSFCEFYGDGMDDRDLPSQE